MFQNVRTVECVFQDVQSCGVCASECLELWSVCIRMLELWSVCIRMFRAVGSVHQDVRAVECVHQDVQSRGECSSGC